jgi:hypothetical protein
MNFGEALELLNEGRRVARSGWNGKGMWLELVFGATFGPGAGQAPIRLEPFIVMKTAQETFVPWLASQTDVLAADWEALR